MRPEDWKGSDLRSRTEVVQYLQSKGGEITDKTGLAAGVMREEMGRGRALTQLLSDMEHDGMIEREVRGRRTFRIRLLDDWGLAPRNGLRPVPDPPPDVVPDGVDYDQLAEALLAIAIRRATAPIEAPKVDSQVLNRLKRAESNLEEAKAQIRDLRAELKEARRRTAELEEVRGRLEHNLEIVQRQLTQQPKGGRGVSIRDRLSAEERATLDQLMTALPEAPGAKPRKRTR